MSRLTINEIRSMANSPDCAIAKMCGFGWVGGMTAYEFTRTGNSKKDLTCKLKAMTHIALQACDHGDAMGKIADAAFAVFKTMDEGTAEPESYRALKDALIGADFIRADAVEDSLQETDTSD